VIQNRPVYWGRWPALGPPATRSPHTCSKHRVCIKYRKQLMKSEIHWRFSYLIWDNISPLASDPIYFWKVLAK
jgi:hypothetical protein